MKGETSAVRHTIDESPLGLSIKNGHNHPKMRSFAVLGGGKPPICKWTLIYPKAVKRGWSRPRPECIIPILGAHIPWIINRHYRLPSTPFPTNFTQTSDLMAVSSSMLWWQVETQSTPRESRFLSTQRLLIQSPNTPGVLGASTIDFASVLSTCLWKNRNKPIL